MKQKKDESRRRVPAYPTAFLISILIWAVITHYHFVRRGVWNPFADHELNPLFLANKGLALTAVVMICLSVILGPTARFWPSFVRWVAYRKHIGLTGAGFAFTHILVALFLLPQEFPPSWFAANPGFLAMGILAFTTLLIITLHSTGAAQRRLGPRKWKIIQRLVYPAIAFACAHYMWMGKPANWLKWSRTLETPLPPGTLVITLIVITTLIVRLAALRGPKS